MQTCFFLRARSTANSSFTTMGKKNNQKLPRNRSTSSSSEQNVGNSYKEEDRVILVDTDNTVKDLKEEINALKLELN